MISENEDFSKYCRRTLLRIRPPRKFDVIKTQVTLLTNEVLENSSGGKNDLEVLKKLQEIENLIKDL